MFTKESIVKRTVLTEFEGGEFGGINEEVSAVIEVKRGVLPRMPSMHPTRVFHKGTDRLREMIAMQVIGLVAPDIAIPMVPDAHEATTEGGVYMRWVSGHTVDRGDERFTRQQKYDFGCISVIDALIGNADRHDGNLVVSKAHVYPIDHGLSMSAVLTKNLYVRLDVDWNAGYKYVYAGICDTLELVQLHAVEIERLLRKCYTRNDITPDRLRRWAAKIRRDYERENLERERFR